MKGDAREFRRPGRRAWCTQAFAKLPGRSICHGRLGLDALADVGIDSDAVPSGVGADLAVLILGVIAEAANEVGDLQAFIM